MKRIDWSEFEEDSVIKATKELLANRKVPLPVQDPWKKPSVALNAIREAQVVLPEGRRRPLATAETLRGISPKLIAAGIIKREDFEPVLRGTKVDVDKNLVRINQLADERDAAVQEALALKKQVGQLELELQNLRRELKQVPSEAQVLKNFVADIFMQIDERRRAVPGVRLEKVPLEEVKPAEPRPPRHEPEPTNGKPRKPKIVVVGGNPAWYKYIEDEVGESADVRYFDPKEAGVQVDRLKAFRDPAHGRVVYWANYSQHRGKTALEAANVPYVPYFGERGGLVATILAMAKEMKEAKA